MVQISIIDKSQIERKRLDSEFYLSKYLQVIQTLKSMSHSRLGDFCFVTSGSTPPDRDESLEEGIILLKTRNIQEGYIDLSHDIFYIDKKLDDRLKSTKLKSQDILLNIVGATLEVIGRVAIVPSDFPRANITQAMALIRIKEEAKNDFYPEYVFAFLFSKYGRLQVCRLARPTGQFNINHREVREILLPEMPLDFQLALVDLVDQSIKLLKRSKSIRLQAEKIILEELGFEQLPSQYSLTYTANLSSCIENNRIDPEFYRPEYEVVSKKIAEIAESNSWMIKTIKEISEPLKYGASEKLAYLDEGVPFLRITDVQDMDFDRELLCKISEEQAKKVKYAEVKEGDLVISRSGTLGLTIPISRELSGSIFGSYFIRIRPKIEINHTYLAFYLNSILGKVQVERNSTGTIQTNLTIPVIEKMKLLIPQKEFQERISALVDESKALRHEAKRMLKYAKVRVEEEIEKNLKPSSELSQHTQST